MDFNNALRASMKMVLDAILNTYGMTDCKPQSTPAVQKSTLELPEVQDTEAAEYHYRNTVNGVTLAR